MFKLFFGVLLSLFLLSTDYSHAQQRSRPINISKKKFKQIQSRRYVSRERTIYRPKKETSFFDVFRPTYTSVRTINNNSINRKKNQKMIARKRRQDDNYQYYRDYMSASKKGSEKNNFSIYDK